MKKLFPYSLTAILILAVALSGCGGSSGRTFSIAESLVQGAASFPTGTGNTGTCTTVTYPYYIAQTEVTYQLWSTVYTWANAHGYTFANQGNRGGNWNTITSEEGTYASGHETDPVTTINWRDAIVWCNVLTEYYNAQNKTSLGCVYKSGSNPIKSALGNIIAAGKNFSLSVNTSVTSVYAWGDNGCGQMGNEIPKPPYFYEFPVQATQPDGTFYLTGVTAIAAGENFVIAKTDGATLYGWGNNNRGQLAQGNSTTSNYVPTLLTHLPTSVSFTGITAGAIHAALVTSNGKGFEFQRTIGERFL